MPWRGSVVPVVVAAVMFRRVRLAMRRPVVAISGLRSMCSRRPVVRRAVVQLGRLARLRGLGCIGGRAIPCHPRESLQIGRLLAIGRCPVTRDRRAGGWRRSAPGGPAREGPRGSAASRPVAGRPRPRRRRSRSSGGSAGSAPRARSGSVSASASWSVSRSAWVWASPEACRPGAGRSARSVSASASAWGAGWARGATSPAHWAGSAARWRSEASDLPRSGSRRAARRCRSRARRRPARG